MGTMGETTLTPASQTARAQSFGALVVSVLVLVAAVVGLVFRPLTASALVYAYALEEGQSRVYSMSMRAAFTPRGIPGVAEKINETMTGKMTMKVLDVADDGSTLLEMSMSDTKVSGNLSEPGEVQNGTVKMRISKSGELLSMDGSSFMGFDPSEFFGLPREGKQQSIGSSNLLPSYPTRALEPGDTWSQSSDIPIGFGNSTMHVSMRGEHLGFEESTYGRVARMKARMTMPLNLSFTFAEIMDLNGEAASEPMPPGLEKARMVMDGTMAGDAATLVVPDTCDMVTMGMNMKMDVTMRLENVPSEIAAFLPPDFGMVGTIAMKLNRIS